MRLIVGIMPFLKEVCSFWAGFLVVIQRVSIKLGWDDRAFPRQCVYQEPTDS